MFKRICAICSAGIIAVLSALPANAWFGSPFGFGFGAFPFGFGFGAFPFSFTSSFMSSFAFSSMFNAMFNGFGFGFNPFFF
jgi:hypothetical protein